MAAVFTIFFFMQQWTDKRLNKLALIFFVLAMEYLFLKLMTDSNPVFLADLLKYKTNWTRWNIFTGYTGATLWILLSNLLFYQAFFKQEKINWLASFVAVLTVIIPIVYSLSHANMSLEKADVINFYSNNSVMNPTYSERGELISRTGVWVSVLIIIFTLIKGMTKKTSR
jgi:apolipoprotein N-acyltransferase